MDGWTGILTRIQKVPRQVSLLSSYLQINTDDQGFSDVNTEYTELQETVLTKREILLFFSKKRKNV